MIKQNTFFPKFTITNAITQALTQIERARGFLEAATLSEDWVKAMGERALVLEAHYTTHIEGTHLTLSQAEMLLAGESVPEADPDDTRELKEMIDKKLITSTGATNRLVYQLSPEIKS